MRLHVPFGGPDRGNLQIEGNQAMKKILFASTALVLSAGVAAAEVTVGGDGRMGVVYGETPTNENEFSFNSRIRISFTATGETDTGLAFGGSIRADNAAPGSITATITDANGLSPGDVGFDPTTVQIANESSGGGVNGLAGSVFVSGAFGKLSMGDVDSAAQAAVGQVSGVGYTGIGDLNEISYIGVPLDESALYEGTFGGFTVYGSIDQISDDSTAVSIAAGYEFAGVAVALGYEDVEDLGDHIVVGASGTFAGATLKAVYGHFDVDGGGDIDQFAISADYTFGATTVTGFVQGDDTDGIDDDTDLNYGIGAAYDLGGGAVLKGGIAHDGDAANDADVRADFGITMSF